MKYTSKIITICVLASSAISCAATPNSSAQSREAVLLNPELPEVREAIRVFVRKDIGRFVIADPDSLAASPNMIVHRRARDYESGLRKLPAANLNYRLVSDGNRCWLIRHETDANSPLAAELILPDSAICTFYSAQ